MTCSRGLPEQRPPTSLKTTCYFWLQVVVAICHQTSSLLGEKRTLTGSSFLKFTSSMKSFSPLLWFYWFCFVLLTVNVAKIARNCRVNCYREYTKVILYHGLNLLLSIRRKKIWKCNANIGRFHQFQQKPPLLLFVRVIV
jgi:hypothetical protein